MLAVRPVLQNRSGLTESGGRDLSNAMAIHEAYLRGDLEALKAALGDPPDFPNCRGPRGVGENILEYAIYWSPKGFVRALLELGAEPNYGDHAGFPALLAALAANRSDKRALIELLLSFGAEIEQRGINDWTPLHYAVALGDRDAVQTLLSRGADPSARTRIDDLSSPLQDAEQLGLNEIADLLRSAPGGRNHRRARGLPG